MEVSFDFQVGLDSQVENYCPRGMDAGCSFSSRPLDNMQMQKKRILRPWELGDLGVIRAEGSGRALWRKLIFFRSAESWLGTAQCKLFQVQGTQGVRQPCALRQAAGTVWSGWTQSAG